MKLEAWMNSLVLARIGMVGIERLLANMDEESTKID